MTRNKFQMTKEQKTLNKKSQEKRRHHQMLRPCKTLRFPLKKTKQKASQVLWICQDRRPTTKMAAQSFRQPTQGRVQISHRRRQILEIENNQRLLHRDWIKYKNKISLKKSPAQKKEKAIKLWDGRHQNNLKKSNTLKWTMSPTRQDWVWLKYRRFKSTWQMYRLTRYQQRCKKLKCSSTDVCFVSAKVLNHSDELNLQKWKHIYRTAAPYKVSTQIAKHITSSFLKSILFGCLTICDCGRSWSWRRL